MQAKTNASNLNRYNLSFPHLTEDHIGIVPSIHPPAPLQKPSCRHLEVSTQANSSAGVICEESEQQTCFDTQARYPLPHNNFIREVKQSALDLAEILRGAN